MHYLIALVVGALPFLGPLVAGLVGRIAISIGFGTVAFAGINLIFDSIISKVNSSTSGIPSVVLSFISMLGIDTAINIFMSAGTALFVLKGMNALGTTRKTAWRKPGDKSDWNIGA